jgi:hypothetical protein
LPLSLLDHNLVHGNALVGIGRLKEIEDKAQEDELEYFRLDAKQMVGKALEPLARLARAADATAAEVKRSRKALAEARERVEPAAALCDVVTALRLSGEPLPDDWDLTDWDSIAARIVDSKPHRAAQKALASLTPLHFPIAFPEVFLRDRSGFDVILGNPPWEMARVEEHGFWTRHMPGLRSITQRERESVQTKLRRNRPDLVELYEAELAEANALREALLAGPFPGMGTGDPDLYKAFCWRFWSLVSQDGGRMGVVLPRAVWSSKGTTEFRSAVLPGAQSVDLALLVNNRQWVFAEVHSQYSIGLSVVCRGNPNGKSVRLQGPFASL